MADKPSVAREGTMEKTIAESQVYLANSNKSKKAKIPKFATINQTCKEAEAFCGDICKTETGRALRKRKAVTPPPVEKKKPKMKRAGTMVKTAKEGKNFLKRGKKGGSKAAAAAPAEKKE